MINRYGLKCGACTGEFLARMELSPTRETRFAFPCPACGYVIRGHYRGLELERLEIVWDDATQSADQYDRHLQPNDKVITVGTTVPLKPSARRLDEFGGGPNLTFGYLVGDNYREANDYHGRLHAMAPMWRDYERFLHFYLAEDWPRFLATGSQLFEDAWVPPKNPQERHITALLPALVILLPLIPGAKPRMLEESSQGLLRVIESTSFVEWVLTVEQDGSSARIQQRLFRALQEFTRRWEAWSAGVLVRTTEDSRKRALKKLRLFRDDFSVLRDLYVQIFETCCDALPFAMAILNTDMRGKPDAFGPVPSRISQGNSRATPPSSLAQFDQVPNATKLRWFDEWPTWASELPRLLDKDLRNDLGHANAHHDIAGGTVIADRATMAYLDLTAKTMDLLHVLLILLQIVKSVRLRAFDELSARDG